MEYKVIFTQYFEYDVEAESEDEAIDIATEEFKGDMSRSIARTWYDNVEVEEY